MTNDSAELPTPFGPYVLQRLLAEGGMAEIFLAERRTGSVSKLLALKRILPHLCREKEFVAMFMEEARLAAKIDHPNVVQLIDFGEVQGRYFLAMEFLHGETLGEIGRRAKARAVQVPINIALQIMSQVCDGLHYAHELSERGQSLQIVHRDISPSNVMVTFQGAVKVVDFGVARAADRQQDRTATGVVKGKYPYCSPEQIQAPSTVDRRSDIFSLMIVFYELITGRRVFRRDSDFNTCRAVIQDPVPPPSIVRPELSKALDAVVLRALEKDPAKRHQSCQELRVDLERLIQGHPTRVEEFMGTLYDAAYQSERKVAKHRPSSSPTSLRAGKSALSEASTATRAFPHLSKGAETSTDRIAERCVTGTSASPTGSVCPHASTCALFPKFQIQALLKVWKINFCDATYTECARYKLSSQNRPVPLTLLPNGKSLNLSSK